MLAEQIRKDCLGGGIVNITTYGILYEEEAPATLAVVFCIETPKTFLFRIGHYCIAG